MSPKLNDALVERVAEAIYNRIYENRWKDLSPHSIDRQMYTNAAIDAIAAFCEAP